VQNLKNFLCLLTEFSWVVYVAVHSLPQPTAPTNCQMPSKYPLTLSSKYGTYDVC